MKTKNLFILILFMLCTLSTLVFVEVFLRIRRNELLDFDNFFVKFRKSNAASCIAKFDGNLGWVSDSNIKERRNNYRTRVSTKENGIRINSEKSNLKSTNGLILAVGDSFAFGDQVSNNETWASHLEEKTGIPVLNAGMCGYGIDQSYLRAKQLVEVYKPTTIILSYTSYDIPRSRDKFYPGPFSDDRKPYFEKENGDFVLKGVPIAKPKDIHEMDLPLVHRVASRSALLSFLLNRFFPDYWWSVKVPSHKAETTADDEFETSCHIVKLFSELGRTHSLRTILFPQPFYELAETDAAVLEKVMACGRKYNVEVLDISNALLDVKTKEKEKFDTFYFSYVNGENAIGHGHMTNVGNEFAAEQISRFLKAK